MLKFVRKGFFNSELQRWRCLFSSGVYRHRERHLLYGFRWCLL